jgi:hypothetical protein
VCCACHRWYHELTSNPMCVCVACCRYQGQAAAVLARSMGIKNMGMVYEDGSYGYGEHRAWAVKLSSQCAGVPFMACRSYNPEEAANGTTASCVCMRAACSRQSTNYNQPGSYSTVYWI